jgi:hypothetical protein
MNPRWWQLWGKWAFIGFLLLAIVMTVSSGDGWGTAKMAAMRQEQPAEIAYVQKKFEARPALEESRVELERMDAAALQQKVRKGADNAFSPTSWYVPPPPPLRAKPQPPPIPTAPPMPFSYLGLYEETPGKIIMLVKGGQVYTVSVGDVIENTYRIDRVEHGVVEFTYLPLNIKQSISTGNPS